MSEGDPKPLLETLREVLDFPIETVELVNAFLRRSEIKVEMAILKFFKRTLPESVLRIV